MDGAVLTLDANLDLRAAAPLREAFLERQGADLVVDASRVERIGGLCLQVLLSARETWRVDGLNLSVQHLGEELRGQLRLLGASDLC